ncbi:MAG: 23S rRNA (guanosine(2251)-2'-O)-methyltransferase RlmB [Proteobacteria bacterium]|nr:23S rRNA (guanosine(2251)-2'-O)-methyltransferase RlmB [Pseudomonadota bacterium]
MNAAGGTQVLYGLHAVRIALERNPARVRRVRLAAGRDDARVRTVEELARRHQVRVERVEARVLQQALGDVAHQGVVADIEPLPAWDEDQLLEALAGERSPLLLALDGVQDPHNLGACLRTADACGALAVIVPRDRAAQLTPTARKVAAGAAESVPVVSVTNLVRTLKLLKEAGLWVVGADTAGSRPAQELDLTGPVVLVLGAEGSGLRHLTREHCDYLAHLPQLGTVESLNVSVAAGMLLYEAVRQRRGAAGTPATVNAATATAATTAVRKTST